MAQQDYYAGFNFSRIGAMQFTLTASTGGHGADTVNYLSSTYAHVVFVSGNDTYAALAADIQTYLNALGGGRPTYTVTFNQTTMQYSFDSNTGTLALAADVGVSARACALVARRITGFDATTPLGGSDAPSKLNADAATLPGSAMTTGRAGNVILADACTKAGTITSATSTTLDGMAHDTTGADTISNLGLGFGHKLLSAIGSITPDWTFDVASRMAASVVEINVAP